METLFLDFWGTSTLFSTVAAPIYISTNSVGEFPFLYILRSIYFLYLFSDACCDRCVVIPHCSFDWQWFDNFWCIFPYACIVLCFVSTAYLLKLASWKLALFGILQWFTTGHFLCLMSFKALLDFGLLRDLHHLFHSVSVNLNQPIAPRSLSTFFGNHEILFQVCEDISLL